jgi:Putative Actinobacterial Holin-X, holin superfamily III
MAGWQRAAMGQSSEASVAELVQQLSEQTSRLARHEVELAKAELAIKGKRTGFGAGTTESRQPLWTSGSPNVI